MTAPVSTATTRTHPAPGTGTGHPTRTGGVIGVGLALAATLTIFEVRRLVAPIRVVTGWAPNGADLTLTEVIATVAVAVAAGAGLLGVLQRRSTRAWRAWILIAVATAVLSAVPLFRLDVSLGSKLSLASMHLATGAAAILGHALARRRARTDRR